MDIFNPEFDPSLLFNILLFTKFLPLLKLILYYVLFLGSHALIEKLKTYKPRIAVFNGKGIYEIFSGKKEFHFGKQPEKVEGTETVSIFTFLKKRSNRYRTQNVFNKTILMVLKSSIGKYKYKL